MKSLLEFYNELPESAQSIILYNCSAWFDPDAPGGLIKPLFDGTMEPDAFLEYAQKSGSGQLDLSYEECLEHIGIGTLVMHDKYDSAMKVVEKIIENENYYPKRMYKLFAYFLPSDFRRLARKYVERRRGWKADNFQNLITLDDYSEIKLSDMLAGDFHYDLGYIYIFGKDQIKQAWKENLSFARAFGQAECYEQELSDIFDELFFGEDGWTEEQKIRIVRTIRCYEDDVKDFMRKIVAVDKKYLKYIEEAISSNTALAQALCQQQKPQSELTGNETREQRYRYPKELRKLFQICGCCVRKSLPKTRVSKIGDVANIVKLYNYNFSDIFDAMYPETVEAVSIAE